MNNKEFEFILTLCKFDKYLLYLIIFHNAYHVDIYMQGDTLAFVSNYKFKLVYSFPSCNVIATNMVNIVPKYRNICKDKYV